MKMKLEMENMEFKLSIDVFESVIRILDQILINLKVGWILRFWAKIRFFMQNFKKKAKVWKTILDVSDGQNTFIIEFWAFWNA